MSTALVNAMLGVLLCRWLVWNINEIFCFERRHIVISWCITDCNVNSGKKRQSGCQMMHIVHFYSWILTWIMSKLLESASFHTPTSPCSSSLVFQTLSISSVDFQVYCRNWAELWMRREDSVGYCHLDRFFFFQPLSAWLLCCAKNCVHP